MAKLHTQKIAMYTDEEGVYQIEHLECHVVAYESGQYVQYPRSFFTETGDKYILDKYLIDSDLLLYKRAYYDPWLQEGHKHFQEENRGKESEFV